jgi:hypothetical protein
MRETRNPFANPNKNALSTSVIKRDNAAKKWIVRWQFRGGELFRLQACSGAKYRALLPYLFHDFRFQCGVA